MEDNWKQCRSHIFWGEIAPCDHIVQIYESNQEFLNVLADFAGHGIYSGEAVIIIATAPHLKALKKRLQKDGVPVDLLISRGQYIPLIAEEALSKFMINGWPDEDLFTQFISGLVNKARKNDRQVRAFGEMVAILWAEGHSGATVQLEHLWNQFVHKESIALFCAYPKSGFTQSVNDSIINICEAHSKMIKGAGTAPTLITYKNTSKKAG